MATTAAATGASAYDDAATICVCFLEDVTAARSDFTIRKLSRQAPAARVIICLLGDTQDGTEDEEGRAPRSLTAVMAAIEKSTAPRNRREQ